MASLIKVTSGIVYEFQCVGCNFIYYGKTKQHLKIRICEDLIILPPTLKIVQYDDNSAIRG